VNLTDPANTVFKVGTITYVLVPTPNLPLVGPLRALGLNALADQLQAQLKPLVDQAYNRNYPGIVQPGVITAQPAAATITGATSTRSAPVVVLDSTVARQNATVPPSLAPAPPAPTDPAPAPAAPQNADGDIKGRAVADTAATTPPSDSVDELDAVKTRTPSNARPGLDNATAARQSSAAPNARTSAASTTNGAEAVTGNADENSITTNNRNQSVRDGKKRAPSNE
jgi:hypothetical protein